MTFGKALNKLIKGKAKSIKNSKLGMYAQTLESLQYWFCQIEDASTRIKNYQDCIFSKTWEIDES